MPDKFQHLYSINRSDLVSLSLYIMLAKPVANYQIKNTLQPK